MTRLECYNSMHRLGYNISTALDNHYLTFKELGEKLSKDPAILANHILEPHRLTVAEVMMIGDAVDIPWRNLLEGV